MNVTLIDCTGNLTKDPARYAAAQLIFAKNTRLEMDADCFGEIYKNWSDEQITDELEYICRTIPSSWEFVNYTVLIQGVSRAFTHQLVRTRTASFAQQTMRILDVGKDFDYSTGKSIQFEKSGDGWALYQKTMKKLSKVYRKLIDEHGVKPEDARGILPTNIHTNILMHLNLRTVSEMVVKRSSPRVQGEYREFIEHLRNIVVLKHPWASMFLARDAKQINAELSYLMKSLSEFGHTAEDRSDIRNKIWKLIDQLRSL